MNQAADGHADLMRRLGPGARYDSASAPAEALSWARLGTAYFARILNNFMDEELTGRSEEPSPACRIVAEVAYEARAMAQVAEWARTGLLQADVNPFDRIAGQVDLAATLPASALRNLFRHSEVHLNVEWRDLDAHAWSALVRLPGGASSVRDSVTVRASSIWLQAAKLGDTGSFRDIPPALIDALLVQVAAGWAGNAAYVLRPSDRTDAIVLGRAEAPQVIGGIAADLASWLSGRPPRGLTSPSPIPVYAGVLRPSNYYSNHEG